MKKETAQETPKADLQTAQSRMFPFVCEAFDCFDDEDRVGALAQDPAGLKVLFAQVQSRVFDLLNIGEDKRGTWHMGIADSGKRTIELLVNALCPAEAGKNAIVDTENYVGFNKFSAATALAKQKEVAFEKPFNVSLGRALTSNSEAELNRLSSLFEDNRLDTLWLAWNSTSTGIQEDMAEVVERRNQAGSDALIIADAASLRLFSEDWRQRSVDELPDVFFFSLRKQGLPYEGPNDEFHQARNSGSLIIFNNKALQWSLKIDAATLYDSPTLAEYAQGRITAGEQRRNHIKHLLKLDCALKFFLDGEKKGLATLDAYRLAAQSKIKGAFPDINDDSSAGFALFADPDAQSDSAYILKVPANTSAKKVIAKLKQKGVLISACMHPKMDSAQYVRFAFYPGNTPDEVECLLDEIGQYSV